MAHFMLLDEEMARWRDEADEGEGGPCGALVTRKGFESLENRGAYFENMEIF